jgi:hypothetical protein
MPMPLSVVAQGTHISGDDRLILCVHVSDDLGKPLGGLKKAAFKVWQLGHLFGDLNFFVVDLGNIPELVGLYHLVVKLWSPAVNGTFAFYVRAQKGKKADQSGWTLTSVVKVKS